MRKKIRGVPSPWFIKHDETWMKSLGLTNGRRQTAFPFWGPGSIWFWAVGCFRCISPSRKPMAEAQERQSLASSARCQKRFALLNPGQWEISDDNRRNRGIFRHTYPKYLWWQRRMMSGPRMKNQRLGDSMISGYWENTKVQIDPTIETHTHTQKHRTSYINSLKKYH